MISTDQNLEYQQNLAGRRLAIVVLTTTNWPRIRKNVKLAQEAVKGLAPGAYVSISFPD